nr:MAG TPA: hypothetical protein [Caudoviricetes sp.]
MSSFRLKLAFIVAIVYSKCKVVYYVIIYKYVKCRFCS